jgi:hypothetical protein
MNQGCTTYLHNVPTEQGTVGSSGRSFHAKHGTGPSPLPPTVHTTDAFEILGAVVGAQIDDQRQHLLRIRQVVVVVAVLQRTGASAGPHVVTAPNVARVHLHRHSRVFPNVGLFQLFRRLPWPIRPRKHGVAVAVHPLQRPLRQVVVAVVHAVFQPLAVPRMAFHEWRSKNGRQNKNVKKKKERDFSKITTKKQQQQTSKIGQKISMVQELPDPLCMVHMWYTCASPLTWRAPDSMHTIRAP